jgi:hypothetical protein
VDRADVRVIERRGDAGLALQALNGAGVARELVRQELQRDTAAEAMVARFVDLAHASRAELGHDLVMRYLLTYHGTQTGSYQPIQD